MGFLSCDPCSNHWTLFKPLGALQRLQAIALCSSPLTHSLLLLQQVLMFGAVGAFDWAGGIVLYDLAARTAVFLNETKEEAKKAKYSYLGKLLTSPGEQTTT